MVIETKQDLIDASDAANVLIFDSSGNQINTGRDGSPGRVTQPAAFYASGDNPFSGVLQLPFAVTGERTIACELLLADLIGAGVIGGEIAKAGGLGFYGGAAYCWFGNTSTYFGSTNSVSITGHVGETVRSIGTLEDDGLDGLHHFAVADSGVKTKTLPDRTYLDSTVSNQYWRMYRSGFEASEKRMYRSLYWDRVVTPAEMLAWTEDGILPANPDIYILATNQGIVELANGYALSNTTVESDYAAGPNKFNLLGYNIVDLPGDLRDGVLIPNTETTPGVYEPETDGIVSSLVFGDSYSGPGKLVLATDGSGSLIAQENFAEVIQADSAGGLFDFGAPDVSTMTASLIAGHRNTALSKAFLATAATGKGYLVVGDVPEEILTYLDVGMVALSLPLLPAGTSVAVIRKSTGATLDKRVIDQTGYSYSYLFDGADIDFEVRIAKEGFKPQRLLITAGESGVVNNVELEPFDLWQTLATGEGLTTGADVTELTPLPDRVQMTVAQLKAQRVFIFAEWLNTLMDWIDTPYFMALESRGNSKVYFIALQTILVDVLAGTHGTLIGGLIKNASGIALTHPDSAHYLQIDPEEVYEYIPAVGAEKFTEDDRTQLNKGLTADEFAAAV